MLHLHYKKFLSPLTRGGAEGICIIGEEVKERADKERLCSFICGTFLISL